MDESDTSSTFTWDFPTMCKLASFSSRTSEKWKAKEDKAEEFKKQKIQKNDDGQSYANWQTSSWSWQQPKNLGIPFLATMEFGRHA